MILSPQVHRIAFALLIVLLSLACVAGEPQATPQGATPPKAGVSGYYVVGHQEPLTQANPPSLTPNALYGVGPYSLYSPQLAEGDGREETNAYCSMCHSTRYITMQPPLPAGAWEAVVTKMDKTFGAHFPPDISAKIVRYLKDHYTPESRHQ